MSPFDAEHFTDLHGNELENRGEPSHCPFCGSGADNLVVERWSSEDDPDASYHVECLECGCKGPQADSQLGAVQAWNGRST